LRDVPVDKVAREIRAAQLNTAFRLMPIALVVNIVNGALTLFVLQRLGAATLPLAWFCILTVVTAARWILWWRHRGAKLGPEGVYYWSLLAVGGSLLAGLCWGIGGAVLFPVIPLLGQIFLTLVIGGMCAGGVVVTASHLPALLAFLLSASLPMAVRFFCESTITYNTIGTMILVFAAALSLAGRRLNNFFSETLRLRFELDEANLRLRAEIAEHRATEAALRQAQKLEAIGRLTGGIAHDFNNLLTIVSGNLMLAIGRTGDDSATLPLLRGALQAADRGAALVQRLLAFARRQRLDPQSVDLKGLVSGIEDLLHRTLGREVRLAITADADLAPALVDANQLELAILNLVINARDAMPGGGVLCIGLQNQRADSKLHPELSPGDYVVVSILDTGTGMDEATLARAFEPFFTTKEMGSGSGLGLPMVQGFAVQSGGTIQIRSKPGEGTTVELWLPQAKEQPASIISGSAPSQSVAPRDSAPPAVR
jgi:signal transduction histidine kinase